LVATGVLALASIASAQSSGNLRPKGDLAQGASARTEILTYDNWTVTCRDGQPKEKRVCSAELAISQETNNQRRVVFAWLMGLGKDNVPTSAFRFLPGVSIAPGLELKFPEKAVRKVPITVCEPTHCEATAPMDDAFVKEAAAAIQAEVVVHASDGRQVTFTVNMKGFSQALAAVRKP
jgi:invasion protein IalB